MRTLLQKMNGEKGGGRGACVDALRALRAEPLSSSSGENASAERSRPIMREGSKPKAETIYAARFTRA